MGGSCLLPLLLLLLLAFCLLAFSFCCFSFAAFSFAVSSPSAFNVAARIGLPVEVLFAGGRFVGRAGVAGRVADHGLADGVGLVARFALLRLAGPGDVRVGVVVQVVVVDRRTDFAGLPRIAASRSIEGPLAGAEEGKPSALTPSGESTGSTRASVPTPMFSENRLATLRNASVR